MKVIRQGRQNIGELRIPGRIVLLQESVNALSEGIDARSVHRFQNINVIKINFRMGYLQPFDDFAPQPIVYFRSRDRCWIHVYADSDRLRFHVCGKRNFLQIIHESSLAGPRAAYQQEDLLL